MTTELTLVDEDYESASGHVETTRDVRLRIENGNVVLTDERSGANFIKGGRSQSKEIYTVAINDFIEIMKREGKRAG